MVLFLISVLLLVASLKGNGAPICGQMTVPPDPDLYRVERVGLLLQGIVGAILGMILLCCALASALGY